MISHTDTRKVIRPDMTVRQIVADLPTSRIVFERYGERNAPPARFGHLEPLTHFARRQRVPLEKLLSELAAATGSPVELRARSDEQIHHGFILSALLLTLTLGAGFGVWLLWTIGMQSDFHAVPAAYVVAHGEAQLWGFIVLFVMGISLRTVLQGVARHPLGILIVRCLLAIALLGIGGGMLWSVFPELSPFLGVVSSVLLLLVCLVFWSLQIALLQKKWRMTWVRAVLASGLWLSTWAIVTIWFRWSASTEGPDTYNDAQRLLVIELAVFGFGMNSIYGFGQKLLPGLLRTGRPHHWAIELSHWLHNAGVVVVCLATSFFAGDYSMIFGTFLLATGALLFCVGYRGFFGRRRTGQRHVDGHPSLDYYPPLAFFWLVTTLILMTGGALYETMGANPAPHAFMGAMRHALTVGFMTTLILGVGQRIIPVLDHTVLSTPYLAVPILALIGFGNLLRVLSELATLYTPAAFPIMAVSGFLELTALSLFTACVLLTFYHRDSLLIRGRIIGRSSVAILLAEHPWIEDQLRPMGTRYLERTRSVPGSLTIGAFARSQGVGASELVGRINNWLAKGSTSPAPTKSS